MTELAIALGTHCKHGHLNTTKALIAESKQLDINQSVYGSDHPLIVATTYNWADLVQLLISCDGIDVNCTDHFGETPVSLAAQDSNIPILHILLDVDGIDQNTENEYGETALMRATVEGRTPVVRVLVTAKGTTDINRVDGDGNTLLHDACNFINSDKAIDIATVLLIGGSCRFIANREGNTPLDMAKKNPSVYKDLHTLFASGIDYWQRKHHADHSYAMRQVVTTALLIRQRLDAASERALLPEEIWLKLCTFLRSADFACK
jgi:ankyrin repeat protein